MQEAVHSLVDVIKKNPHIRVLAFGETHHIWANPFHRLCQELLPLLKMNGFTCLALEWDEHLENALEAFSRNGDLDVLKVYEPKLPEPIDNGSHYYELLTIAIQNGFKLVTVDVPNMPYNQHQNRNEHMCKRITGLLNNGKQVVWLGGLNHMWIRSGDCGRNDFRSAAELLEHVNPRSIYSIAEVTPHYGESRSIRFDRLELLKEHKSPIWINRDQLMAMGLAEEVALSVKCDSMGRTGVDCPPTENFHIKYKHWDSIYWCPHSN